MLAGNFYLFNEGFLRHPRCRCTHIPYAENVMDDERTDPAKYFESLTHEQQDKVFAIAAAEAIRLGAQLEAMFLQLTADTQREHTTLEGAAR